MDDFEEIISSLPEKPARSRLDPHGSLIRELLRRGWTYRAIAQILLNKCSVRISISTIHHFVHARSRPKRKLQQLHRPSFEKGTVVSTVRKEEKEIAVPRQQIPTNDDLYQRIAALKQRPTRTEAHPKSFEYDPNKPLNLVPKHGKGIPGEDS